MRSSGAAPERASVTRPEPASVSTPERASLTTPERAVLLLSGGLDSATLLALAGSEGYEVHALTFRYGQRHDVEIDRARQLAAEFGVASHRVVDVDIGSLGGSALTDASAVIPMDRSSGEISSGIPATYVPARNTIFLSLALAAAEVIGATKIFIGVNAVDYSGYPDCRPEYIAAFNALARLATRGGVSNSSVDVVAPLVHLSKAEIIRLGLRLGVDYAGTVSCYSPSADGAACGRCDACQLRLRGFAEAGTGDPARYLSQGEASA